MDADVLEELYHRYYRSAVLYCISLCGTQQLAEDIATDAFVKAYLSLPNDVTSFRYWLMKVCKNLWIDYLRKHSREVSDEYLPEISDGITPETSYILNERNRCLWDNDGLYPVVLNIPLSPNRRNGDYAAKIMISGQTENGEPVTEAFPYVIRIRDGYSNPEALVPKIKVSGDLKVGEDCTLNLTIQNPTKSLSMTDCELTLTDASGEVLMSGSNRMALPEILPGQTAEAAVPVTVKGNAAVEPHCFSLKLTYQVLGEDKIWEETITYPVNQEIRLEQGGITMPSSAIQGELTTLSVPLMNMGKGDICNAMVSLEFPELIPRQSVLVGTIEPGATGQAKLTFTSSKDALGDYSGMVTISCEDPYGNSQQWQLPVDITIEAAPQTSDTETDVQRATAPEWLLPLTSVLCVILLVGMILQGALLRSKLHRLEEERL